MFDSQGRRIAEYTQATGAVIREYVWMGWGEARPDGLPVEARQRRTPANAFAGRREVAVVEGGVISYIRTDHIGRPIFGTNSVGAKVWTASRPARAGVRRRSSGKQSPGLFSHPPHPFGGVRTTTGTPINALRAGKQSPGLFAVAPHPGQWFQRESGLHQNWMRDYDPTTGRYLQADPLGLVDGECVWLGAGQTHVFAMRSALSQTLPPIPRYP